MTTHRSLCVFALSSHQEPFAIRVATMEQAQPRFQRHAWSASERNYIGPYWEVTLENAERVRTGAHIISQSDCANIDAYLEEMYSSRAQLLPPMDGCNLAVFDRAKDCVAMADGAIYEISMREGKPQVRLFPVSAPQIENVSQAMRERAHA